jgi:hypothetical protein
VVIEVLIIYNAHKTYTPMAPLGLERKGLECPYNMENGVGAV